MNPCASDLALLTDLLSRGGGRLCARGELQQVAALRRLGLVEVGGPYRRVGILEVAGPYFVRLTASGRRAAESAELPAGDPLVDLAADRSDDVRP